MTSDDKGFLGASMSFGGGDEGVAPAERAPLLPLRIAVVADLVPKDEYNAGASAPEAPIRVDASRFDDLFIKLRPRIAVEVPSVLQGGARVRLDLAPSSMKSFRPDGLCAELPLLRSLLDGRIVIGRLGDGSITTAQCRSELERLWAGSPFVRDVLGLVAETPAAPTRAPESPAAATGSIFDLVDMGESVAASTATVQPAAKSALSGLIASVAASGRAASSEVRPDESIARIDKAIGVQIGSILQHPEVRRLEEAWRGLRFLVDRAQGHSGILVDVVSAPAAEAPKALLGIIRHRRGAEPPVSFAVVDVPVDGSAASFSRAADLAEVAEALTVPVIANASPSLLGVADLGVVEKLDNRGAVFDAAERAPWRAFAASPAQRWLVLGMNRVLARSGYEASTSRVREASVNEAPRGDAACVWMSPSYAIAALAIRSFRETGWPCRLFGDRGAGLVGDLPVREARDADAVDAMAIPTERFVSTEAQRDLARAGVLLLASAPNSDNVYVLSAPTAYVPTPGVAGGTSDADNRPERVSLVDQLFVARLAQFLSALCSQLPASAPPEDAKALIERAVFELFRNAAPATVELAIGARSGVDGTEVDVHVRPRRFLGVALEEIGLSMPLG